MTETQMNSNIIIIIIRIRIMVSEIISTINQQTKIESTSTRAKISNLFAKNGNKNKI